MKRSCCSLVVLVACTKRRAPRRAREVQRGRRRAREGRLRGRREGAARGAQRGRRRSRAAVPRRVRPRHGVRRARRQGEDRQGRGPRRRRSSSSSRRCRGSAMRARLRKDDADTQGEPRDRARAGRRRSPTSCARARASSRRGSTRVIDEQRGVLDEARGAWVAIKQAGGADPLAQQGTLTHLADRERGIVAEAGVIGDLAADEIDAIGKKPEDKRDRRGEGRASSSSRTSTSTCWRRATRIAEARRKLQDLAAEDARRAGGGRARRAQARARAAARSDHGAAARSRRIEIAARCRRPTRSRRPDARQRSIRTGSGRTPAEPLIPAWLEPPALAERQSGLRDRLEEVRARDSRAATSTQPPATGSNAEPPKRRRAGEDARAA